MNSSFHKLLRRFFNPLIRMVILASLLVLAVVLFSNLRIRNASLDYLYDSEDTIPGNRVGLVLGTAPFLRKDVANPYFQHRIAAAAKLYHARKVEYLIVSGDNRTRWYNEPEQMRRELVAQGVPDSIIYLDYAGLRTLDSVVRARKIFGQQRFTIISQKFHNQRAVFLARSKGLHAIGFNADDVSLEQNLRTQVREWFARVKVFYDLLIQKQPRHLGDPVMVGHYTR